MKHPFAPPALVPQSILSLPFLPEPGPGSIIYDPIPSDKYSPASRLSERLKREWRKWEEREGSQWRHLLFLEGSRDPFCGETLGNQETQAPEDSRQCVREEAEEFMYQIPSALLEGFSGGLWAFWHLRPVMNLGRTSFPSQPSGQEIEILGGAHCVWVQGGSMSISHPPFYG